AGGGGTAVGAGVRTARVYDRYAHRVENYQLPKTDAARQASAAVIGVDGQVLLHAIDAASAPPWLREVLVVQTLRRVWAEQYTDVEGMLPGREVKDMPSLAERRASPYEPEARDSTKREVEGIGYKVHFPAPCEPELPHVIVNAETTPATTPNDHMVESVQASLEQRALLPGEPLVDKGYTDSQVLVDSQQTCGVTLIGPGADDPSWQARAGT